MFTTSELDVRISNIHGLFLLVQANVYKDSTGTCAAFLANIDDVNDTVIVFQNKSYHLPAWSVSILPDCKNVAFNTAKVFQLFLFAFLSIIIIQ